MVAQANLREYFLRLDSCCQMGHEKFFGLDDPLVSGAGQDKLRVKGEAQSWYLSI